jgi:uncharacterized damage-inducible protein DinB
MRSDELRFLVDYDGWAMERVLETAVALSNDAFTTAPGPGHVAVRDAVLHCVQGMRGWRQWLQGEPPPERRADGDAQTVDAVGEIWRTEHGALEAYVAGLGDAELGDALERRRPDRVLQAERWQFVTHLMLHNMQHRSELAQALTLLGHSPGELGLTAYLQHQRATSP